MCENKKSKGVINANQNNILIQLGYNLFSQNHPQSWQHNANMMKMTKKVRHSTTNSNVT